MDSISLEKNKPLPFYKKHFRILVVVLFLVLLLPGYFLLISPENKKYTANKELYSAKDEELTQKISKLQKYKKTVMNYESISGEDKEKIAQIVPVGPDEASLYVNLKGLADQIKAEVKTVSIQLDGEEAPLPPTPSSLKSETGAAKTVASQLKTLTINFNLADISYNKVKQIFNLIENNARLLDVRSFAFSPENASLDLVLRAYYLK